MQARIVAVKDLTLAGATLKQGDVMASMDFKDPRLAEFFAARLGWSFFRVELDLPQVDVGSEPITHLPIVFDLLGQRDEHGELLNKEAGDALLKQFTDLGIRSIADLAKANVKALRGIKAVGNNAGAFTRAAKVRLSALRHAALTPDVIEIVGEAPQVVAVLEAPAAAEPTPSTIDPQPAKPSKKRRS